MTGRRSTAPSSTLPTPGACRAGCWDLSPGERAAQPCIGQDRADLVVAGCAMLEAILDAWPVDRLRVADRGVREGILFDLMAGWHAAARQAARAEPPMARQPGSGSRPTGRGQHTRVKTAGKRKSSSTRWLQRQLNDPYVAEARKQGYRSRAAFKLLQLDEKVTSAAPRPEDRRSGGGARRLDPGRGSAGQTGGGRRQGRGAGLSGDGPGSRRDDPQVDFLEPDAPEQLKAALGGPADLVLSDMAAPTTGHPATDHLRIMGLAEAAAAFASEVLAPGGAFVCKLFQGGAETDPAGATQA